jgi:transcriptional regulator GlxA family with amidase domain
VREHLHTAIAIDVVAEILATSQRTLTRRLDAVLGKTPIEYIQDLRIERAVHLVGYADGQTLRTLLRRRLGKGVRELRAS